MDERRLVPGVFFHLVEKGAVPAEALAGLIARLPAEEQFVRTAVRDGYGFDSARWPVAWDAALAQVAARRLPDPEGRIGEVMAAIEEAAGEREVLRGLARRGMARMLAAVGAEEATLLMIWSDATAEDRAVFAEARWSAETASDVAELTAATYDAADGLYAYHAHRGVPGPSALPAARLIGRALERGVLSVEELIAAAIALVERAARPE
jgi:hypothetical protein